MKTVIILLLAVLPLLFQNCLGEPDSGAGRDSRTSKGNGEGYGGKPDGTYINYDTQKKCSQSGQQIFSKIISTNGKTYQVMDNCQSIDKTEVDHEIVFMPHNTNSIMHHQRYHQRISENEENLLTEVFCRGTGTNLVNGLYQVVDVTIQQTNNGHVGQINLGVYQGNSLIESRDKDDVRVQKMGVPELRDAPPDGKFPEGIPQPPAMVSVTGSGADHWVGFMESNGSMDEMFNLSINKNSTPWIGLFTSILNPELGFGGSTFIRVDNMECVSH